MFIIQHEFYENTVTTLTLTSPYSATLVLLLAMFSFWGEPVACESLFNFVWLIMNDRKWCKEKVSPEFPLKAFSTKFVQTKCCCNWNAFLDGEANWVEVEGCRWKTFEKLGNKLKQGIFYVHILMPACVCVLVLVCMCVCVCAVRVNCTAKWQEQRQSAKQYAKERKIKSAPWPMINYSRPRPNVQHTHTHTGSHIHTHKYSVCRESEATPSGDLCLFKDTHQHQRQPLRR